MGEVQSSIVDVNAEQLMNADNFQNPTKFKNEELRNLFRAFKKLDLNNDGFLQKDEFMAVESLQQNPLVTRVLEIFDEDGNDKIDFTEFITAISLFCFDETKQSKFEFVFQIYDVNGDGYISNGDLFRILKIMVGDNLNDTQLQQLVDRTIMQADEDKDGKLNKEEFMKFIKGSEIESKLVIDLNMAFTDYE